MPTGVTRALIIMEPWIGLIMEGEKTWELRLRATKISGRIGLIRSKSGLIVGGATLVDCMPVSMSELRRNRSKHHCSDKQLAAYANGRQLYAWVMEDAKQLKKAKPYEHPPGAVIWVNIPKVIV